MNDERRPQLTADDITALRTASEYTVRINPNDRQGIAEIECIKKVHAKNTGPFGSVAQDLRRTIAIDAGTTKPGFFYVYGNPGAMRALALIARTGDRLSAHCYTNNNQYVDQANLFHDVCGLTLSRTATNGREKRIVESITVAD